MARRNRASSDQPLKFLSLPVHVGDILIDTATMTDAEFGYYCRLLFTSFRNKGLPVDLNRLVNIAGGASGTMDDTTTGSTAGYTDRTTESTADGTYGGQYTGTNRRKMWEFLKGNFEVKETDDGPILVNPRVEKERDKIIKYHQHQVDASKKGVEARRKKAKELAEKSATTGSTTGHTAGIINGSTVDSTERQPNHKPGEVSPSPNIKGEGKGVYNNGTTTGATAGTTTGWLKKMQEAQRVYYPLTADEFFKMPSAVTAGVTPESFERWKRFTQVVGENELYHPLFEIVKFVEPKDFAILEQKGLRESQWILVIEKYLKTGVDRAKHNLYFKLGDAMKNLNINATTAGKLEAEQNQKSKEQQEQQDKWQKRMEKLKEQAEDMVKRRSITREMGDWVKENLTSGETLQECLDRYKKNKRSPARQEQGKV